MFQNQNKDKLLALLEKRFPTSRLLNSGSGVIDLSENDHVWFSIRKLKKNRKSNDGIRILVWDSLVGGKGNMVYYNSYDSNWKNFTDRATATIRRRIKKVKKIVDHRAKQEKVSEILAIDLQGLVQDDYPDSKTIASMGKATCNVDGDLIIDFYRAKKGPLFQISVIKKPLNREQLKEFLKFYKDL